MCRTTSERLHKETSIVESFERERMNMLVSECSSGCESGWTLYFEHSMDASHRDPPFLDEKGAEDEEEDLSMVSDASSGPPHLHEEEEEEDQDRYNQECFNRNSGGLNKKKCGVAEAEEEDSVTLKCRRASKRKKKMGDHHPSFLDDTASSPLINFFPSVSSSALPPPHFIASITNFSDPPW